MVDSDNDGIVVAYFDGDYRFQVKDSGDLNLDVTIDWDNVKLTSDSATMWEGNSGTSFPTAAAANRWHQFAQVTAGNELVFLGLNNGSSFRKFAQPIGKGADIVSLSALVPGSDGDYFDVTGTTTITSITGLGEGSKIRLHFDGAVTVTHNASSLVLPSGNNIVTQAGDELTFFEYSSGNWRLVSSSRPIEAKGADIISTAILPVLSPGYFDVTGTVAITSIADIGIGSVVKLHFDGILTITHNATDLLLPGATNITTSSGDEATFIQYAVGDWRMVGYSMAKIPAGISVPLARMATSVLDSSTAVLAGTSTAPAIQAFSATHRFYKMSIRGDGSVGWADGSQVDGAETVIAALHSNILRNSTFDNDVLRLVNGTGASHTAIYKIYDLTET